ncbi:Gfo/Idh/MocA family protein [Candidatus Pelagibacter sp.]|uniref:Gfo/Idh/MocA family protein n=1 Tax=Candidatus Pelagibacter sp. TaxID=2024849 RepID=UPI003F828F9A
MIKKINVGVIGLGVGNKHLVSLKKNKSINKIKIYDFNQKKLNYIAKKYQVEPSKSEDEIINDKSINLVCIASYDNYHFNQIVKSIRSKKHIFVEKPAVDSLVDAKKIIKLLKKNKKIYFSTNYILRKSPRFIKLNNMIKMNKLGKIFYIEADYNYGRIKKITHGWRGKIPFYSVTNGGGVHIIDLVRFLLNKKIIELKSYANKIATKKSNFKFPDCVVTIAKLEGNIIAKFTSNFGCVYPHFHKLNIYGTKKTFENHLTEGRLFIKRDDRFFTKLKSKYKTSKSLVLDEFIYSIIRRKNRIKFIKDTFDALSVCFAIDKSYKMNKSVKINYLI